MNSTKNKTLEAEFILHFQPEVFSLVFARECRFILLFSFWLTCQFGLPSVFAAGIQMNGTIREVIIINMDGAATRVITNSFSLSLDQDKWKCKTTQDNYAELLTFDGTNTYTQHVFPPPVSASQVNTNEITTGEIRKGSSCIDGICGTRVLWMALCGKAFYESDPAAPIISPWGFPQLLGADSIAYKAEWLDVAGKIPKTVRFTMSDVLWRKELATKRRDENELKPFKDGELMGEYNVLVSTQVNNIVFPKKFLLVRYAVNKDRKPVVYERFEGEVDEVRLTEEPFQLTPLHMQAQVLDFRFSNDTQKWLHVTYKAPRGEWPATNDPMVISNLNAAIAGYADFEKRLYPSLESKIDPRKSSIARWIMVMSFLLPPIVYFFVLVKRRLVLKNKQPVKPANTKG